MYRYIYYSCIAMFLLLGCTLPAKAQEGQGINFFHGSWEEAKAEAKSKNLPMFVDCFTSWCGPCRKMSTEIFTQGEVGAFYNKNFLCYKLDMEKGDGPSVARAYTVAFYPTFLFFNAQGEIIHRAMGAKGASEFINDGRKALDPNGGLYSQIKAFHNGKNDTAFLRSLIISVHEIEPKTEREALAAYWKQVPQQDLIQERNYYLFHDLDFDIHSPAYQYVLAHKEEFYKKYGKEDVLNNVYGKAIQAMEEAGKRNDEAAFMDARNILAASDEKEARRIAAYALMMYNAQNKKWKDYTKLAADYLKQYGEDKPENYMHIVAETLKMTDDKSVMKKTEGWAEEAVKLNKNAQSMYLLASVQYNLDKLKDAEKTAKESISLAQLSNKPYNDTQELLKKIYDKQQPKK